MFDKIVILNNTIKIIRFVVVYTEEGFPQEEKALDKNDAEQALKRIERQGLSGTIIPVEVPPEIEQYDGMKWNSDRNKAIQMINGVPEYKIEQLKKQLVDMDYKTSKYVDGDYTEEEWAVILLERKNIREEIRELEKKI